jgi:CTP:molybdopterin cytidylyltransferase MocA
MTAGPMPAGLVLAAGRSTRMGSSKLVLPWKGGQTIVGSVVSSLRAGGVGRVLVVVGGDRAAVEAALAAHGVEFIENPDHESGEMLASIQVGLRALDPTCGAALTTPGDLPAIRPETVQALLALWQTSPETICAPTYAGRRGHPVVLPQSRWNEVLALPAGSSLREYLRPRRDEIRLLAVDDPGIHADVDTPGDYPPGLKPERGML